MPRFIILHSLILVALGFPFACYAQISHLDSSLAQRLTTLFYREAGGKQFALVSDSGLAPLLSAAPLSSGPTILNVENCSATVSEKDLEDRNGSRAIPVLVNANGIVLTSGSTLSRSWAISDTMLLSVSLADRALIETNRDRYVVLERELPQSFWSGIAEPALVVIGAIAIVALFFLIRS